MHNLPPELLLLIFYFALPSLSLGKPHHLRLQEAREARRLATVSRQWRELLEPTRSANRVMYGAARRKRFVPHMLEDEGINSLRAISVVDFVVDSSGWPRKPGMTLVTELLHQAPQLQSLSVSGWFLQRAQIRPISPTLRSLRLHNITLGTGKTFPVFPLLVDLTLHDITFINDVSPVSHWLDETHFPSLRILALRLEPHHYLQLSPLSQRLPELRGLASGSFHLDYLRVLPPFEPPPFLLLDVDPVYAFRRIETDTSSSSSSPTTSSSTNLPLASPSAWVASTATHIRLLSPSTISLTLLEDPAAGKDFFRGLFSSKRTSTGRIKALYLEEVRDEMEDEVDRRAGRLIREVAEEMGVPVEMVRRGDKANEFVLPRSFIEDALRE